MSQIEFKEHTFYVNEAQKPNMLYFSKALEPHEFLEPCGSIIETLIGGMQFYIIDIYGNKGYRKLFTPQEYARLSGKISWLH